MVGRDAELAAIDADLVRARAGACRVVLIRGDAGTGKSRLLNEVLVRSAAQGFDAVVGRAEDQDRRVAYASLRLALAERLRDEDSPRLAGPAARLDALLFGVGAPETEAGTPDVLDLVHEVVATWADRRPLVLAIDDLHSADPETVEAYAFLGRHLTGSRVVLVATVRSRPAELTPDVAAAVDRLRASTATTVVELDALRGSDLAALIRSILGDEPSDQLLDVVEEATAGNPFFTVELVRSLRDDDMIAVRNHVAELPSSAELAVPSSAAIAVLHRVFRLGETARAVARVAAAFAQIRVDQLTLVADITGLQRRAVEDAFDLLARAGILEPSTSGYRFAHGIVRSALYDDLGPAERRRVHAMIAAHIAARREANMLVDVVDLATHIRCCAEPGDAEAAAILLEAGDAVVAVAPRSAVEWYRDALAVLPGAGPQVGAALLKLTRALSLSSRHDEAAEYAASAMAALAPGGPDWTRAAALRLRALAVSGQTHEADRLYREELAGIPAFHHPRILAQRAQLLDSLDRLHEADGVLTEAERIAEGTDRVWVAIPRLHLSMSVGDWATGRRLSEALAQDLASQSLLTQASKAISLLYVHSVSGDPHEALEYGEVLKKSPLWTSAAAGALSRALTRVGRWDDGLAAATDAVSHGGARGLLFLAWFTISFVAAERAEPPLDVEVIRARLGEIEQYTRTSLLGLAYLDVAEGREERARMHLAAAIEADQRSGRCNVLAWTLDLKAELDWLAGDRAGALAASDALDALADDDAWLVPRLNALLTRATIRADRDAAEQAEQLATDHRLPLELARAMAARGALTDDADRLADAYSRLGALGAARRQRQVSVELRRLGRRGPRGPRQTELSAAERQLAALVAQGFTNREIADRVHLSVKTIEAYLGRIFRKVGCSSRLELALAVNSGRRELR